DGRKARLVDRPAVPDGLLRRLRGVAAPCGGDIRQGHFHIENLRSVGMLYGMVGRGTVSPFSPRPFPHSWGKGGGSGGYIPRRALGVAQPGLPVKGAEHRRTAAALPLTGCPGCAM